MLALVAVVAPAAVDEGGGGAEMLFRVEPREYWVMFDPKDELVESLLEPGTGCPPLAVVSVS